MVENSGGKRATAAEIAVFKAGFDSMRPGFGGSLSQLDAYLAQQTGEYR